MMRFRRLVFWCHLVTGVTIGVIVLVMSVSGVLMSFERQVVERVDLYGLVEMGDRPHRQRLSPSELIAILPDSIGPRFLLTWRADHRGIVEIEDRNQTWFLDAGTAEVVGAPDASIRAFFESIEGVHRWLAAPERVRGIGRSVTGLCNMAFLFMLCSGIFLWWPRNWRKAAVLNVVLFRRGLSRKARNFNRHNVLGIWSVIPLILIAGTGVMISYPAAGDAVFSMYDRVTTDDRPVPPGDVPGNVPGDSLVGATSANLLRTVERLVPDWRRISMTVSADESDRVHFLVDRGTGGQPHLKSDLVLSRATGAVVTFIGFEQKSKGTRFFDTIRYVHTGEVLGPAGQFLAGLVTLSAVFLVWTGLTLAWIRWMRRRSRR